MKKYLFGLLAIPLLLAPACTPVPVDPGTDTGSVFAHSEIPRNLQPVVDDALLQSLAAGNRAFAVHFYHQIKDEHTNIIFSPLSLSLALSMTLAGAKGETRDEMLQALALQELGENLHPAFNALLLAIESSQDAVMPESEGDHFQLNIANSTWGQSGYTFDQDFLDLLAEHYGAGMYGVDFVQDPEAARQAINAWVAEKTEDKIPELIPEGVIDPMTLLVLANAIYFNGSWLYPFQEAKTSAAPFTLVDGSQIQTDMMHLDGKSLAYIRGEGYQAVRLPYLSHDFSMVVIVPDAGTFEAFEGALSPESLTALLQNMHTNQVNLQLPKFDFETSISAPDPLQSLGMLAPFSAGMADFSGITQSDTLYISDVIHKATITVDEMGTEAAAATAVIMSRTSMPVDEPISLVVDRPFLFSIQHDPSGTLLFLGCVLEP